jgi:Ca2+/H+ antiporter
MVTIGNPTEMLLGNDVYQRRLFDLVKGTTIGGILANILLIPGLNKTMTSAFRFREERFDRVGISLQPTLLLLFAVGLTIPTIILVPYML